MYIIRFCDEGKDENIFDLFENEEKDVECLLKVKKWNINWIKVCFVLVV